eukprot:TRINITY_DN2266_c0_g1_i1.p1 TRINITY_DN2266_c0_g1~~TRINITY_DN2266_c0_g1_i1.p1  ORF type:complete len:122 (-),score=33.17 TRINITY_DN2266_c0_g1_i1:100-465(-)
MVCKPGGIEARLNCDDDCRACAWSEVLPFGSCTNGVRPLSCGTLENYPGATAGTAATVGERLATYSRGAAAVPAPTPARSTHASVLGVVAAMVAAAVVCAMVGYFAVRLVRNSRKGEYTPL